MQISQIHFFLLCMAIGWSSAVTAQSAAVVDLGEQGSIQSDAAGNVTVRVNGAVVNTASGAGAKAETNIGSRTSSARAGAMGNTSSVTMDEKGVRISVTTGTVDASSGVPTQGKEYVSANLAGMNFAATDLSGASFVEVDLSKANLRKANLQGATFVEVLLDGADLREANLRDTEFVDVSFDKANLTGADLTGATFVDADVGAAIRNSR